MLLPGPTLIAIGIALVVSATAGAYFYGHHEGYLAGEHTKQVEWDRAEFARRDAAMHARDADREEGFALAAEYEQKNRDLEHQYEDSQKRLTEALRQRVTCPKSGMVGDVVVPAAVVRGMFGPATPAAGAASAAGPAASEPAAVVR